MLHRLLILSTVTLALTAGVIAQSSDAAFPTPLTSNELTGTIRARDIGDPRLTTYYYVFDGVQGDIFINVVAKNFTGDIDVFTQTGQRPLTKMVFYADADATETGRLIYLRRPERLILRVEGRPPGDDAATFDIKFGGSFVALAPTKEEEKAPTVEETAPSSGITVNSVGTIVAVAPKPKPTPKATPVETTQTVTTVAAKEEVETPAAEKPSETRKKPVVVVEDYPGVGEESENARRKPETPATPKPVRPKPVAKRPPAKEKPKAPPAEPKETAPDPLAGVRLVIVLKDGTVIEKDLTALVRFTFDKGVLTVIAKDGGITRYQMTDVAQVNVQ